MAYEIDQRNEADYRWFRFEAPTELLDELDHNLKIADGVLRFRIFKVDPDAPVMVPPAVPRRARARASARAAATVATARDGPRRAQSRPRLPQAGPPSASAGDELAADDSRRSFCGYSPAAGGESRAARALRLESRQANPEE